MSIRSSRPRQPRKRKLTPVKHNSRHRQSQHDSHHGIRWDGPGELNEALSKALFPEDTDRVGDEKVALEIYSERSNTHTRAQGTFPGAHIVRARHSHPVCLPLPAAWCQSTASVRRSQAPPPTTTPCSPRGQPGLGLQGGCHLLHRAGPRHHFRAVLLAFGVSLF